MVCLVSVNRHLIKYSCGCQYMTKSFLAIIFLNHKSSDMFCQKGLFSIQHGPKSANTTSLDNIITLYRIYKFMYQQNLMRDYYYYFILQLIIAMIYLLTHNTNKSRSYFQVHMITKICDFCAVLQYVILSYLQIQQQKMEKFLKPEAQS